MKKIISLLLITLTLVACSSKDVQNAHDVDYYPNNSITVIEADSEDLPKIQSIFWELKTEEDYTSLEEKLTNLSKIGYSLYSITNNQYSCTFLLTFKYDKEATKYTYLIKTATSLAWDVTKANSISANINHQLNSGYELYDIYFMNEGGAITLFYRKPAEE